MNKTKEKKGIISGSNGKLNPKGYITYILLPQATEGDYAYPEDTAFEVTPYWVTYDGVTVTGTIKKQLAFGENGVLTENNNVSSTGS